MTPARAAHQPPLQQRAVLRWYFAFVALALAAALALASPAAAASLLAGALLGLANFHALFRFSSRALFGGGGPVSAFALRFVLLAAALWLLLRAGASPVALLIGLSLIMPAVLLAAIRAQRNQAPALATPANEDAFKNWNPWLAREIEKDEEAKEA